jgi:hypothetical protein
LAVLASTGTPAKAELYRIVVATLGEGVAPEAEGNTKHG